MKIRMIPSDHLTKEEREEKNLKALDKADKIIFSKIDMNTGLKYVYIPLLLVDSSILIISSVRDLLAQSAKANRNALIKMGKADTIRQITRDIKSNLDAYEQEIRRTLGENRKALEIQASAFYEEMKKSYEALLRYCAEKLSEISSLKDENLIYLLASCYLVMLLLNYKDEFEKKCLNDMQKMLEGTTMTIKQNTPKWHFYLRNHTGRILKCFGVPEEIDSEMIQLYLKVMDNKIAEMDMVAKANELFND